MASNNIIYSAGVYTNEIDISFRPLQVPAPGLAVIGPTARGPAMRPIDISTYAEYIRWFGDVFASGSGAGRAEYKYLNTYAVQEYLRWGDRVTVLRVLAGDYQPAYTRVISKNGSEQSASYATDQMSFTLHALSDGDVTNSGQEAAATSGSGIAGDLGTNGILNSGSKYNMRWEVANVDPTRGTFDVIIRRGDDSATRKIVLEQFIGVSLDPNSSTYIGNVIGTQTYSLRYDSGGTPYLQSSGSYPNRSRFVRVEVHQKTLEYLNTNGTVRDGALSGSLPGAFSSSYSASTVTHTPTALSGTFAFGSDGNVSHPRAMYEDIWNLNTQGLNPASSSYGQTAYQDAIDILSNKDQYDFDLLALPGLIDNLEDHARIITRAINMVEDRADAFLLIDPTYYGSTVGQAQIASEGRNTNYAAYYYPWVQIQDPDLGGPKWVPPSAVITGVYAFNDYVGEKWFAPAGLNRGGIDLATQTERFMTQNDRDNLYRKGINPIATFPREGIAVWGQKTLQKKASALDRINVRRLLIAAKRHVSRVARYMVFDNNTRQLRNRFLSATTPWFDDAQAKQGLYDFKIIIDEGNNTPEVVDRNEMRAEIHLKPAKTAEFIIVDFIIHPTGATFPGDEPQ